MAAGPVAAEATALEAAGPVVVEFAVAWVEAAVPAEVELALARPEGSVLLAPVTELVAAQVYLECCLSYRYLAGPYISLMANICQYT